MIALLLWMSVACDAPAVLMGAYRIAADDTSFCVAFADRPEAKQHHQEGLLIAVNRNGVVFKKGDAWFFLDPNDGQAMSLKSPGVPALQNELSDLTGPAFYNQDALWRWYGEEWVRFPLDVFFESKPPKPVPASQFGLNLLFPQIGDISADRFFMYQEKSGQLYLFERDRRNPKPIDFGRERRAFWLDKHFAWSGAPDEEDVSLAESHQLNRLGDQVRLSNLNKHSMILSVKTGAWVLTFPSGIRDGLKSWDSGRLPVKGSFLWLNQSQELQKTDHELPKLPLNFELTTSTSGSPRLNVDPRFQVFGVFGSDHLIVLADGKLHGVSPQIGLKTRNWDQSNPKPLSFVRLGKDLGGYDETGAWKLFFKGWF